MSNEVPRLAELRLKLAALRIALRSAEDDLPVVKAKAEQVAIERAGEAGYGKNAEDRARYLTIALSDDLPYVTAVERLRVAQSQVDMVQAEIETQRDERREREADRLERLIDALTGSPAAAAVLAGVNGGR